MASKRSAYPQSASGRTIEIPKAPPRRRADSADPDLGSATGNKLIVGRSIKLRGEIASCDVLVVEGQVEASMASRLLETHPRIDQTVRKIRQDLAAHEEERTDVHHGSQHREVVPVDRVHRDCTQSGDAEERFEEQRARE